MTVLTREQLRTDRAWQLTVAAVVGAVLLAYSGLGWPESGLYAIGKLWLKPPYDYSHGFLVLPFALYLLWRNRGLFPEKVGWPNWAGLPLLLGPLPLYLADADLNVAKEWVQGGCLVVSLTGVLVTFAAPPPSGRRRHKAIDWTVAVLCVSPVWYLVYFNLFAYRMQPPGGPPGVFWLTVGMFALGVGLTAYRQWAALRWAVPTLAMLLLALPLPNPVEFQASWYLRRLATEAGVKVFQTLGFPTRADGPFVLEVGTARLDVQAPCSGLSMLMAFVALTAAMALVSPPSRRLTDRWVVFASSVPIAVFCNIVRIVVSGLVLVAGWKELFDAIVHVGAGYAMIVLALGIVWAEFKLIDGLLVPVVRMSREEVVKAGLAEARAEIERQEVDRRARQAGGVPRDSDPHPAAPFLPLTPAGTAHGATAAGGTITPRPDPGPGAAP
jgi:exosortase/archaeosortase family protein